MNRNIAEVSNMSIDWIILQKKKKKKKEWQKNKGKTKQKGKTATNLVFVDSRFT